MKIKSRLPQDITSDEIEKIHWTDAADHKWEASKFNNVYHSVNDKPALVNITTGEKTWMKLGVEHRCEHDGPAFIDPLEKFVRYSLNGETHRRNGPAVIDAKGARGHTIANNAIYTTTALKVKEIWFLHGHITRIYGPALTYLDGNVKWYLDDRSYNFNEWLELTPISDEEKLMIKLKYA